MRFHLFQITRCIHPRGLTWRRHQMETFSALLAICAGDSPVTGEFPEQRLVMRSFDVFFDLNKRLSKQEWSRWIETPLPPLWRHCSEKMSVVYTTRVIVVYWAYSDIPGSPDIGFARLSSFLSNLVPFAFDLHMALYMCVMAMCGFWIWEDYCHST